MISPPAAAPNPNVFATGMKTIMVMVPGIKTIRWPALTRVVKPFRMVPIPMTKMPMQINPRSDAPARPMSVPVMTR